MSGNCNLSLSECIQTAFSDVILLPLKLFHSSLGVIFGVEQKYQLTHQNFRWEVQDIQKWKCRENVE